MGALSFRGSPAIQTQIRDLGACIEHVEATRLSNSRRLFSLGKADLHTRRNGATANFPNDPVGTLRIEGAVTLPVFLVSCMARWAKLRPVNEAQP